MRKTITAMLIAGAMITGPAAYAAQPEPIGPAKLQPGFPVASKNCTVYKIVGDDRFFAVEKDDVVAGVSLVLASAGVFGLRVEAYSTGVILSPCGGGAGTPGGQAWETLGLRAHQ